VIRRVRCDSCAVEFEASPVALGGGIAGTEGGEIAASDERRRWFNPDSLAWRVVSVVVAAALVIAVLLLMQGGATAQPAGPAPLSVDVSVNSCGMTYGRMFCRLDVSYGTIPGADRYAASVRRPDGVAFSIGSVAAGGTSVVVPYVGPGRYSVRVLAYGPPS
jgi:hypothetical protein